jgi:hypothetical protein
MNRRSIVRAGLGAAILILLSSVVGTGAVAPAASSVQALPTPRAFVSNLDLECFATNTYTPPPVSLTLTHLNPALANLPRETVTLGARTQLCVPVAKNNVIPPNDVLPFIRFVDLSCYRISGPLVNFPLVVSHLNPQLQSLPRRQIALVAPEQFCLPVIKNNAVPPPEVLNLVRYIDLKCYRTSPPAPLGIGLRLTQLNPVLSNVPPADVRVLENRQLCVPVRKNDQPIPTDVLNIVRWIDLEKFDIVAPPLPTVINLGLRHINPLLTTLPAEPASLIGRPQLALPVAKNGLIPPG